MNELNDKDWEQVNAYHDGELCAADMRAFEGRPASEPALAAALERLDEVLGVLCEPRRRGRRLEQLGGGRRLQDEREAAVLEHRDLDRDDRALLVRRARVVLLAEHHDVDARRAERRADRRRSRRCPSTILCLRARRASGSSWRRRVRRT